ncbi:MAG: type II toxin-antitoxin system VapC family toxin [Tepidisphaeraceae bacterium]
MNVQVDTNILTRLAQMKHPHYIAACAAVGGLLSMGHKLCIVPQNLFEFWAVATRPEGENGLGMAVPDAKLEVERVKRSFVLLADSPALLNEWEHLVVAHNCKGKSSHDARIIAAMITHGVDHLLTFNAGDFGRYANITVLDPAAVAAGTIAPEQDVAE